MPLGHRERAERRRRAPSNAELATDVGYPGMRVSPPRLALSLQQFTQSAGGDSIPSIPEGTAAVLFSTAAPTGAVVTVTVVKGTTSLALTLGAQGFMILRAADGFQSASWGTANVVGFLAVDTGHFVSQIIQGLNVAKSTALAGDTTLVDSQSAPPTSIAAASAEAVLVAGANALVAGNRVSFSLAAEGGITTVADILTYVALKGHTSGVYYVVAFAGPDSATGEFDFVAATEKLDVVTRNQDSVAHAFAAFWEATTP